MLGPASVTLGLEHFYGAVDTGRTPVKMLAVCTAESSHAPYPYSHRTQQMNHNSHMFWKRTCSIAAASPLQFQADSHSGNRGRRATAAALKQRAASPAEGGQRQHSHSRTSSPTGRGRVEPSSWARWPLQTINSEIHGPVQTQTADPKWFPPAL
ncbi:unnamed protein product [Coccothraustes coccothraustes]